MNLTEAAASGDRLEALRSLRDVLAEAINNTSSGRDIASLSKQMADVLAQIEECENGKPSEQESVFDVIIRSRRVPDSKDSSPAKLPDQ